MWFNVIEIPNQFSNLDRVLINAWNNTGNYWSKKKIDFLPRTVLVVLMISMNGIFFCSNALSYVREQSCKYFALVNDAWGPPAQLFSHFVGDCYSVLILNFLFKHLFQESLPCFIYFIIFKFLVICVYLLCHPFPLWSVPAKPVSLSVTHLS